MHCSLKSHYTMSEHLVVIGGGQAAAQLIQSSRQHGFDGAITLIGAENYLPYQRPPLSKKYLAGEVPRERLYLKPQQFYADREVELLLGTQAETLDLGARRVGLADGSSIAYDRLALATGAAPRRLVIPGAQLPGVHYLRTIADVDAIAAALTRPARLVIVGAGYIGLELAAVCTSLGHDVTVLETAPRILGRVVCETTAQFFTALHESRGVTIHCGASVTEFVGSTHVEAVRTDAGTRYECDCVIVGIGVMPSTALAEQAGLECANGIVVDACARTADPSVVALGDCSSQPHPWVGRRVRLESVQNAIEQGKAAAAALFAEPKPFADVPWFWSDQYDIKLQIAGLALDYDQTVVRGDPATRSFAVYYLDRGRLTAVDAVNSPRDFLEAKRLLAGRAELPPEAIADTSRDLREFQSPQ
jgi:3-phenylpropionate/trans-cinnamate dioxygenase ferredoxin reductase subunit